MAGQPSACPLEDAVWILANGSQEGDFQNNELIYESSSGSWEFGPEGTEELCHALRDEKYVTRLRLDGNCIEDPGAISVGVMVERNKSLTKLEVVNNHICDEGIERLGLGMKANGTIEELNLSGNQFTEIGAHSLARAIEYNSTVTCLNLQGNFIGPKGASYLGLALKDNVSITNLNIAGNKIGDEGVSRFAACLSGEECVLQTLNLNNNKMTADGLSYLGKYMTSNQSLTELSLSGNKVGPEGAKVLSKLLSHSGSCISSLELVRCDIRAQGAYDIASGLENNKQLRILNLRGNGLGDKGMTHLSKALEVNPFLTDLNLQSNELEMGAEAGTSLSRMLQVNESLHDLNLSFNSISADGAVYLATALSENSHLNTLHLHNNRMGPLGAQAIADAVKVNKGLEKLWIHKNGLDSATMAEVAVSVAMNQDGDDEGNVGRRQGREGKLRFLCHDKLKRPKYWYQEDELEGTKYHGDLLRRDPILLRYCPHWVSRGHMSDSDDD
jgi:Ran GTPase-activating protein (RanGAP) involved in mRNA processing and transport